MSFRIFAIVVLVSTTIFGDQSEKAKRCEKLLSREWTASNERFTVFTSTQEGSELLLRYVKTELVSFCESRDCSRLPNGLVFAIESEKEQLPEMTQWVQAHVNRSRDLNWSSPIKNQTFQTRGGRPYAFDDLPYFREGFSVPVPIVRDWSKSDARLDQAGWVCFLPTEKYVGISFDKELERKLKLYQEELEKVPLDVRLASALGVSLLQGFTLARDKSIDLSLSSLQCREVLWSTWILTMHENVSDLMQLLKQLQEEIDLAWQAIWFRRPLD